MASLIQDLLAELNAARALSPEAKAIRNAATEALTALRDTTEFVQRLAGEDMTRAQAVSVAYLKLCGVVLGGCLMARAAAHCRSRAGCDAGDAFYEAKLQTCRFYAEQVLPESAGLARVVKGGWGSVSEARYRPAVRLQRRRAGVADGRRRNLPGQLLRPQRGAGQHEQRGDDQQPAATVLPENTNSSTHSTSCSRPISTITSRVTECGLKATSTYSSAISSDWQAKASHWRADRHGPAKPRDCCCPAPPTARRSSS